MDIARTLAQEKSRKKKTEQMEAVLMVVPD
jgi:hypothetical protein